MYNRFGGGIEIVGEIFLYSLDDYNYYNLLIITIELFFLNIFQTIFMQNTLNYLPILRCLYVYIFLICTYMTTYIC